MSTSTRRRIPRYMPDVQPRRVADPRELWPSSTRPLVDFLMHGGADLPTTGFRLYPGSLVTDPAAWLESLRRDVARGPDGPRARLGTLQQDIYQLRQLFGRPTFSRETLSSAARSARPPPKPR